VDYHRRGPAARPDPLAEGEGADAQLGSEPAIEPLGLNPELEAALGELGDRERELIALRFGGDLTGPEIAELTGLTLSNVQQILSRALRRLNSVLTEREHMGSAGRRSG
jgi:RNA polymerase sigma-70 factor (ECF subfamily)